MKLNDLWVVTFTCDESINSTTAQGPFESQEVAENFAEIWNNKRDEHIDKIIEEDPDGDYEFYYIKAKAVQLELSQSSRKLLEEIETIY